MTTLEQTNGHREGNVSLPRVGRPPKGEETFPEKTSVVLDLEHRRQLQDWIDWYYPSGKVNLDVVVHEMMDLAYGLAEDDKQRAETPAQRRDRLRKRGQS